jgi:hypothetical protein
VSITSSNTLICLFFCFFPSNQRQFFTFDETKTFCVPPEASLRTTSGTRTTGWEPLLYWKEYFIFNQKKKIFLKNLNLLMQ